MSPSPSSQLGQEADGETGLRGLLRRQRLPAKPNPTGTKLAGQTAIVTGGNGGLGFEASRQLLRLGLAHLVVAVRSEAKGQDAAARLRTEFPSATISVMLVDMGSYDSIQAFVARCQADLPRIDIVILNAALQKGKREIDPITHHELTFQVNYVSTALLTVLILPVLRAKHRVGEPLARLAVVGSDIVYLSGLDAKAPSVFGLADNATGWFNPVTAYALGKHALLLFVARLAQQMGSPDQTGVVLSVVNPGLTKGTSLAHEHSVLIQLPGIALAALLGRSLEHGASTYIHAVVVQGAESHGSFCSDWTIKP